MRGQDRLQNYGTFSQRKKRGSFHLDPEIDDLKSSVCSVHLTLLELRHIFHCEASLNSRYNRCLSFRGNVIGGAERSVIVASHLLAPPDLLHSTFFRACTILIALLF